MASLGLKEFYMRDFTFGPTRCGTKEYAIISSEPIEIGRSTRATFLIATRICAAGLICWLAIDHVAAAYAFSPADPARILYIGDSLAANTADALVRATQGTDKRAVTFYSAFPGMAICDFLEHESAEMPPADRLQAQIRKVRPDLVIMQFWGNAFTKCMVDSPFDSPAYFRRYFLDADAAVRAIESAAQAIGIKRPRILWVLQGPDPDVPQRTILLNSIYRWIAAVAGDRISDAGWTLSLAADPAHSDSTLTDPALTDPTLTDPARSDAAARNRWTQYLPCTDTERGTPLCTYPERDGGLAQLHRDDDTIHFCLGGHKYYFECDTPSPAIERYANRIARDAKDWLGLD